MSTHIVLLRGINVGTHNRIPMAALRDMLAGLGYTGVRTLLASGNAVVTGGDDPATVANRTRKAIGDTFGMCVHTVVRDRATIEAVIRRNPMPAQAEQVPKLFHVGFCDPPPAPGAFDSVAAAPLGNDRLMVAGDTLYLWFADGVQKSPLAKALSAHPLNHTVTLRNWNTVRKLLDLATP